MMLQKRTPLRLFLCYFISFIAALALGWLILTRISEGVREGYYFLLLMPPLGGMAVFHGLFPLLSRIRLGLEFIAVGGGLVYGTGAVVAVLLWLGMLDPGSAVVLWLVGVFGPGWWLLSQRAEKIGYYT
ncbi:hypothetical protein [Roseinatronobacter sp. NSM]|uniref:hypothetical protein n=1 Tax=Roseinatronobacter sp. NSM TaxID=3457785 RepID=UPI004035B2F2